MQQTLQSALRGSHCHYGSKHVFRHRVPRARISCLSSFRGISSQQKRGNNYAIQAEREDSIAFVESLTPVCGSREAARNELRWLREGAEEEVRPEDKQPGATQEAKKHNREVKIKVLTKGWVDRRTKGEPLQYILGTDFFGDIKLLCRSGALIPRWETASIVTYLAKLLSDSFNRVTNKSQIPETLKVLDLCTGSGCIPLQFQHAFHDGRNPGTTLQMLGIDAYKSPLNLATDNREYVARAERQTHKDHLRNKIQNDVDARTRTLEDQASNMRLRSLNQLRFRQADVLAPSDQEPALEPKKSLSTALQPEYGPDPSVDVLVCNPPYVSPHDYARVTEQSVRDWEPQSALVPWRDVDVKPNSRANEVPIEDTFYPRLLQIADEVRAKVVLFEVADVEQARRVDGYARSMGWTELRRIWRDCPEIGGAFEFEADGGRVVEQGMGNGRAVFAARGEGLAWLDGLLPEPRKRKEMPEKTAEES